MTWKKLRANGEPAVIVGNHRYIAGIQELYRNPENKPHGWPYPMRKPSDPSEILKAADTTDFDSVFGPDLSDRCSGFVGDAGQRQPDPTDSECDGIRRYKVGVWPVGTPKISKIDRSVKQFFGKRVGFILIGPDKDWTTILAYLRWTRVYANEGIPVAALRSFRDRYGAELVAISGDEMLLQFNRPPKSPKDAVRLAKYLWKFCPPEDTSVVIDLSREAWLFANGDHWWCWWDE